MRFAAPIHSISKLRTAARKGKSLILTLFFQSFAKKSVNNNSSKLRHTKLLKPTSISERTIKSIFFCDVDLPLFTVGDNFELRLIIKSGLKSLILTLFFQSFTISFRVLLVS